jgi:glycerophosphoryl diester phosphodiesterase
MPDVRRVGHKGAALLAPGNTIAAFDAALLVGVDMIEFDVLAEQPDGGERRLCLAHDYADLRSREPLTLDDALAHLAGEEYAGLELDVDLKLPGYELQTLDALRRHGLLERSLVTSMSLDSLRAVREAAPDVRVGLSVPRLKRDPMRRPHTAVAALVAAEVIKRRLPTRAAQLIREGAIDALMAHWRLVNRRLVRSVQGAGGQLYVWTVDDRARIQTLARLGVDGVITNDPRLFAPAAAEDQTRITQVARE